MGDVSSTWRHVAGHGDNAKILVIGDHASNHVPSDAELDVSPALLKTHVAVDLGSAEVAQYLHEIFGFSLFLATTSRLVVDLNRHRNDMAAIPLQSDGIDIPGNALDNEARERRLRRFHDSYHDALSEYIARTKPTFLLFLHSFTPVLESDGAKPRPWHFGVMYNEDERAGKLAVPLFSATGHKTGDQLPYSGKIYNSSLERHGDINHIPYIGLEMRQDLIMDISGRDSFAQIIGPICQEITQKLASA
ncbi:N-formylglutamate amidohydrolase [Sphingorhabdus sp. Alg239-R122]|uniref:N-formylglutamate amidohydrolase n=1 Tax=Sphingorhabdus sp. Alg239-R122 TaxID=2305989 RepID=UPI0013DD070F|nr:N-formylglutamate amidohydrolase [Sphingorhabdus sp. Alg239-R122]